MTTPTPGLPEPEKALPVVARLRDALASVTRPIGNMVDRHEAIMRRVTAMQEYQSACSFGSIEQILAHIASLESLLASKDAEIERLRADAGRVERNRDMWRGQCERQAERLTKLHISISDHNKDCARQCNQRKEMGAAHCPMKGYDRDCGDCPRDGMLTLANDGSAIEPWMEQEAKYEVEMRALAGDAALSAKAIGGEQ